MSDFPKILQCEYTMNNADINVVGEYLGYDWNTVVDAIRNTDFYAEDGDGSFTVDKDSRSEYAHCIHNKEAATIINKIFAAIFENNPEVTTIRVVN